LEKDEIFILIERSLSSASCRVFADVQVHSEGAPVHDAFAQVIDAVIETEAELFLIAGDLFDHIGSRWT
jgi:hypothetical protein